MSTVADLMTPAPFVADPDDQVGDLRDLLLEAGVHCAPVVDSSGHPVGIVTSFDLVDEYAPQDAVRNAMTSTVITIGAHQAAANAAREMRESSVHHLVVINNDHQVVGVVSSLDLLAEIV